MRACAAMFRVRAAKHHLNGHSAVDEHVSAIIAVLPDVLG
jgi:hypothetical protein